MSVMVRRHLPLAVSFLTGFIFFAEFFLDIPTLSNVTNTLLSWAVIIGTFTAILGTIMLSRFHIEIIRRRRSEWPYSVVLVAVLLIFIILGLIEGPTGEHYYYWFYHIRSPIVAVGLGITFLYCISGAYRTFKVRSLETLILMLATVLGFLNYMPLGEVIWKGFGPIGQWIFDVPSKAASRAGTISTGIGSIILGLRILLGYETRIQLGRESGEGGGSTA